MKMINFPLRDTYLDLLKKAEGIAPYGWICPILANIENDELKLSLGAPIDCDTFIDYDESISDSVVGDIECWKSSASEDLDHEMQVEYEANRMMQYENLEELAEDISAYCAGRGYRVYFF